MRRQSASPPPPSEAKLDRQKFVASSRRVAASAKPFAQSREGPRVLNVRAQGAGEVVNFWREACGRAGPGQSRAGDARAEELVRPTTTPTVPTHSPARTLACALHRAPSDLQGHTTGDASGCRGADHCSQGNWWHVFRARSPWCYVDARASPLATRWQVRRRSAGGARARDDDAAGVGLLARLAHCQAAGRACRAHASPRPRLLKSPPHI